MSRRAQHRTQAVVVPDDDTELRLSGPELELVAALRAALERYRDSGDPAELEGGLAAAQAMIATLPQSRDGGQPRVDWLAGWRSR